MAIASFILLQTLLISMGTDGKRFRTPCEQSSSFRCDNGQCIAKHEWCNGLKDCQDGSDESYCSDKTFSWGYGSVPLFPECKDIHFRCEKNGMCIPIQGYCDGYFSCTDESDEENCTCEELLETEGSFEYEAFIGQYQTQHKCWKLTVKGGQYLDLSIDARLYDRDCEFGNIAIISTTLDDDLPAISGNHSEQELGADVYDHLCPVGTFKSFTFTSDVNIHYRSSWYSPGNTYTRDFLSITYKKGNTECLEPDAFKCTEISCVLLEKRCDGHEDCENGLDEQNCDFATFAAAYFKKSRESATKWMKSQHNADWGWKDNTHRAVVALFLDHDLNFNRSSNEDDLIAKQLELEVATRLLRSIFERIYPTELSAYINALLVICHNPRNFYGFDLIQKLKEEIENAPGYVTPLPYLTLCNAKENISGVVVDNLLQTLENSTDHGFVLEIQALAIMALSCIFNSNQDMYIKKTITDVLNDLKGEQLEDGSFGNEYTTALILQALIANNQADDEDWNSESAVEFLRQKQNADGSFGDFLTTYLVMPILNAKSLVDVGKVSCTEQLKRPKEGNLISDIKSRLGENVAVKYSLFVGDEKDQIHPIILRTPKNVTVLELMALAADIDPKYKFKTHRIREKTYVYEISGIPNDPENGKFWFLYSDDGNGAVPISTQSPDEIRASENDHIIMWYKTINM